MRPPPAPQARPDLGAQARYTGEYANARQRLIVQALERLPSMLDDPIADYARERAEILAEDHARVRAAATGSSRVIVEPVLPPDVIGLYVLVPGKP